MLGYVVGIVSLVSLIFILIKMYPKEGILKTILAFICGLYAMVWGWQHINSEDQNFKYAVWAFTITYILAIILNSSASFSGG